MSPRQPTQPKGLDRKTLEDMIDGRLSPAQIKQIISREKDADRFDQMLAILQDRVPWKDPIILPLTDKLYIVRKAAPPYVVKCRCGHEFGDYRENYKHKSRVFVRNSEERMQEIYPRLMGANPRYMELREFYCPGCFSLLEVESVVPGYPVVFDFLPDLEALYTDVLGRPLPFGTTMTAPNGLLP